MAQRTLQPCGTNAAYQRHRMRGETPCDPCRAGHAKWVRERNWAAGQTPRPPRECGSMAGFAHHKLVEEPVCEPCRLARVEYDRDRRRAQGVPEFKPAACGTYGGYRRHLDRKETTCSDCRRAAREMVASRQVKKRLPVFERDNWMCWLCCTPVDPQYEWPHPFSATIDHMVPVKHEGDNHPSNLACAHARCNSSRGERLEIISRPPPDLAPYINYLTKRSVDGPIPAVLRLIEYLSGQSPAEKLGIEASAEGLDNGAE